MGRILKIFASGDEQQEVLKLFPLIERYDGFLLVDGPDEPNKKVEKKFLVEDISDQFRVYAGNNAIDTALPRITAQGKKLAHPSYSGADNKALSKGKHHYLVQFIGPVKEEWLSGIRKSGGEPRESYGNFSYVALADEPAIARIAALPYVRWSGHLPHSARIERTVMESIGRADDDPCSILPRTRILPGVYAVEFFASKDVVTAERAIRQLGFKILESEPKAKLLVVETTAAKRKREKQIKDLSAVHGVQKIRERAIKRPSNNVAAGIMGTAVSAGSVTSGALGLSGKGEIIAICDTGIDTGDANNINDDFKGRVAWVNSYPITPYYKPYVNNPAGDDGPADLDSGHGTHVAGSVLGDGTNSVGIQGLGSRIRGLAYNAKLVFQAVEQEMKWKNPLYFQSLGRYLLSGIPANLDTLFSYAYQKGARIHSNSWGGGKPGEYDDQCKQLDQFVWNNKDFCILVAAGNDGTDADGDGLINATSVTAPGTAKNCITIGACENKRTEFNTERYGDWWPKDYPAPPFKNDPMANNADQVVPFSSRGPTRDGRIKPDVVAPGTFILSTRSSMIASNNKGWAAFLPTAKYFYMGGTSMATPLAAGAAGLVREYLRTKQHFPSPTAALLKATLIAGAVRLPGMSVKGGMADNNQGFGRINLDNVLSPKAPTTCHFLDVSPGLKTGAVHSIDFAIASSAPILRVVLVYSDYPGAVLINNLNLIITSPSGKKYTGNQTSGGAGLDSVNNTEVLEVVKPATGNWKIEVVGANVPQGPQSFALVYLV